MTFRKILAIVLILAGIALCVVGIANQYNHCAQMWRINDSGKADEFASVSEYFWARSKGAVLISVLGGALLAVPGIVILISAIRGVPVDLRKIIGILLVVGAILFCFVIPLVSIFTYSMPYEFSKKFVSAWECYWYRDDGFLLFTQGVGILLGIGGIRCLPTDFNRRKLGLALLAACGVILLWNLAASLAIGIDTWHLDENLHRVYRAFFSYYFSQNATYLLILGGMLLFPLLIGIDLLGKEANFSFENNSPIF